jgi:hypothetical protein
VASTERELRGFGKAGVVQGPRGQGVSVVGQVVGPRACAPTNEARPLLVQASLGGLRFNLRFHDLRASTVTWMAVRGDGAEKIWQRVGHEDWETMRKYMRVAEVLVEGFGEVFPALPESLLGPADNVPESFHRGTTLRNFSGADGTRTRGLRRDRPAL